LVEITRSRQDTALEGQILYNGQLILGRFQRLIGDDVVFHDPGDIPGIVVHVSLLNLSGLIRALMDLLPGLLWEDSPPSFQSVFFTARNAPAADDLSGKERPSGLKRKF
jgi:hypothetical protein